MMTADVSTFICPKGHQSSESDYCSECGAKIQGAGPNVPSDASTVQASPAGNICPDCGSLQEPGGTVYCEVCGYNFATGVHGEIPQPMVTELPPPVTAEEDSEATTYSQSWKVIVVADAQLRDPASPKMCDDLLPFTVELTAPVNLIGRRNEARAIFPEVALDHDEAVSRRHALLQVDAQGHLSLRDIGAVNGTRLNGKELLAMTDYPLKHGDEITLGHWSRITVHAR